MTGDGEKFTGLDVGAPGRPFEANDERQDDRDRFLSTAEVAERYGVDARTARDIARKAGAIKLGLGYQIRLDHLRAWEDAEAERGRSADMPAPTSSQATLVGPRQRRRSFAPPPDYVPLKPGWWREE